MYAAANTVNASDRDWDGWYWLTYRNTVFWPAKVTKGYCIRDDKPKTDCGVEGTNRVLSDVYMDNNY